MNRCHTCAHWKPDGFTTLPPEQRSGVCEEIKYTLYFNVCAGWNGGYVESVETPGNFGCTKWEDSK